MRSLFYIPGLLLTLFSFQIPACAFTFTASTPTQCGDLDVTWQGGTAPFQLHLIPVFDIPRNISIPPPAFKNGEGTFSSSLPFPEGKQFVIVMSDAQGFGTGGVSEVLTVGPGKQCNTASPNLSFTYQLNSALQQCSPLAVTGYAKGVQPVTFYGVVPLGQTFTTEQPTGESSFNWTADVAADTSIIFFMVDAQGHQGGSSNIMTVASSNDASCLDNNSPSSTHTPKGSTHTPSTSTSVPTNPSNSKSGNPIGGIVGGIIGAILFLAIVVASLLFFRRRHFAGRLERHRQMDLTSGSDMNSMAYTPSTSALNVPKASQYNTNPFESAVSAPYQSPINKHQAHPRPDVLLPPQPQSESHTQLSNPHSPTFNPAPSVQPEHSVYDRRRAKAIAAGLQPPSRYIVHTDAEDEVPRPDENDVVELPPRYTLRFAQQAPSDPPTELPYL